MEKSKVISRLYHKGFELFQLKDFEDTEYALYTKEHINIIVCHYKNRENINAIEEEAENLRSLMHKNRFNAWNTYLLISFECKIDFHDLFVIERSSRSMRRYVIANEDDFNRIPFLDTIEIISNPFNISSQTTIGSNEKIKEIIDFFNRHDGGDIKIKSSVIKSNLNELFDLEG